MANSLRDNFSVNYGRNMSYTYWMQNRDRIRTRDLSIMSLLPLLRCKATSTTSLPMIWCQYYNNNLHYFRADFNLLDL